MKIALGSEVPGHKLGERRSRWWSLLVYSPVICFVVWVTWVIGGNVWIGVAFFAVLAVVVLALRLLLSKVAGFLDPFR